MTDSVPLESVTFQGDGVQLAADVAGPFGAPPVLFLHGGGQTRSSWGSAVRSIAAGGYRAFALDARGHGDSGWAASHDGYALDRFVADLKCVIDALSGPPVLVGASLGGLTSLIVAGDVAPDSVSALVLVDIAPRIELNGASRIAAFMRERPDGFTSLDEAADAVAAYLPQRPRPRDPQGLLKNLRLRDDGRYHWHWDPRFVRTPTTASDLLRSNARLEAAARALTIPTLLLRGALSEVVSPESVAEFRVLAPHAEVIDIAGADHMIAGDRNDAFNAAVIAFLTETQPDPR